MRPTADHRPFERYHGAQGFEAPASDAPLAPNRLRWDPLSDAPADTDFVDGMTAMLRARRPDELEGVSVYLYSAGRSMDRRVFVNADGELLIIPQHGRIELHTELGRLEIAPGSIGLVPRGL